MAGDFAGGLPESMSNNELLSQLKDLEASQISQLFDGVCAECLSLLKSRLLLLNNQKTVRESGKRNSLSSSFSTSTVPSPANTNKHYSNNERTPNSNYSNNERTPNSNYSNNERTPNSNESVYSRRRERSVENLSQSPANGNHGPSFSVDNRLSEEEEWQRFSQVGRKKNFVLYEKVDRKDVNVLQGLELHTGVFSAEEQKKIVECVYNFQSMGRKGQLMARTYSEPKKWMRGKGRVTIQFGCCYNYAVDKDGNPPGIVRDEEVDPLPLVFKQMISKMVRWHVLPPTCVPNSCIVNIYDEGDCIPPHIDHHDFLRPFCTVSFLSECNILFGCNLKVAGPGEFSGPFSIPLPVGSVLVLNGNGADVAKHCVPAVRGKRISVTFRRMDDSKIQYNFLPDRELLNLKPLVRPSMSKPSTGVQHQLHETKINGKSHQSNARGNTGNKFILENNDFPPLGGLKLGNR